MICRSGRISRTAIYAWTILLGRNRRWQGHQSAVTAFGHERSACSPLPGDCRLVHAHLPFTGRPLHANWKNTTWPCWTPRRHRRFGLAAFWRSPGPRRCRACTPAQRWRCHPALACLLCRTSSAAPGHHDRQPDQQQIPETRDWPFGAAAPAIMLTGRRAADGGRRRRGRGKQKAKQKHGDEIPGRGWRRRWPYAFRAAAGDRGVSFK